MIVANLEFAMHDEYNFVDLLSAPLNYGWRRYLLGLKKPQEHGDEFFVSIIEAKDTKQWVYKLCWVLYVIALPPVVLVIEYSSVHLEEIFV